MYINYDNDVLLEPILLTAGSCWVKVRWKLTWKRVGHALQSLRRRLAKPLTIPINRRIGIAAPIIYPTMLGASQAWTNNHLDRHMYGAIWSIIYDTTFVTIHLKEAKGAGAFDARPFVVELVVVNGEMYGVICCAICPNIYGTISGWKDRMHLYTTCLESI